MTSSIIIIEPTDSKRQVAYNPETRRFEQVYPESEIPAGTVVHTQYRVWNSVGKPVWVEVPEE